MKIISFFLFFKMFLQGFTEFINLEENQLINPFKIVNDNTGQFQSGNPYFYDLSQLITNIGSSNFVIGLWVQLHNPTQYEFIMSLIPTNDGVVYRIFNYQNTVKIFRDCRKSRDIQIQIDSTIAKTFAYIYYEQDLSNLSEPIQQICVFVQNSKECGGVVDQITEYKFEFIQTAITNSTICSYLPFTHFTSIAQSLSIKTNFKLTDTDTNLSKLKYLTLLSGIEPEVILNLRILEKSQFQVTKDWSKYQHIAQFGSSLKDINQDPTLVPQSSSIEFKNNEYIVVRNIQLKNTFSIDFQISINFGLPNKNLFVFENIQEKQQIIVQATDKEFQLIWTENLGEEEYTLIECNLGQLNNIKTTLALFYLGDQLFVLIYNINYFFQDQFTLESFHPELFKTLYIGSNVNLNSNLFSLYNFKISNGFYFEIKEDSCYSINGYCQFCTLQSILDDDQCVNECPTNKQPNTIRNECILECHPTCEQCDTTNPTQCTTCSTPRTLDSTSNKCICPKEFFDDQITPECIQYIPDISLDSGFIIEYGVELNRRILQNQVNLVNFNIPYIQKPQVVLNLLGYSSASGNSFSAQVTEITTTYFKYAIYCDAYDYFKIQWVAGQSSSFLTSSTKLQQQSQSIVSNSDYVFGSILGWQLNSNSCAASTSTNINSFDFTTTFTTSDVSFNSLSICSIDYQILEYNNFIPQQFTQTLSNSQSGQGYPTGVEKLTIQKTIQMPLGIPLMFSIQKLSTVQTQSPQFSISTNMQNDKVILTLQTAYQNKVNSLAVNMIHMGIACKDQSKACDYYTQLTICNQILEDCQCGEGYFLNNQLSNCEQCDSNCATCENSKLNCLSCLTTTQEVLLKNTVGQYCSTCSSTQYYSQAELLCKQCPDGCNTCESDSICLTCVDLYYLRRGSCIQYPPYCQLVVYEQCTKCDDGYYLFNTSCNACSNLNQFCTLCSDSTCNKCQSGYYLNSSQCEICPDSCETCTSLSECQTCKTTFKLQNNQCICNDNQFLDNVSCIDCNLECTSCTSLTECTSCSEGYVLKGSKCEACLNSCKTCEIINDGKISCLTCINGYFQDKNGCSKCDYTCLTCSNSSPCSCNIDQYFDSEYICQQCNPNCLTCQEKSTQCTSCNANLHLTLNEETFTCICQINFFQNSLTNQCEQCSPICLTCEISNDNCTSCDSQKKLTLVDNNCICQLNEYYEDQCNPCHSTCSTCANEDKYACLTCVENRSYNLISSLCECNQSFFDNNVGECQSCDFKCQTCSNEDTCLICNQNRKFDLDNNCICIDGYYENQQPYCKKCHISCQTCLNEQICLTCNSNNYRELINQTCQCLKGYYEDINNNCIKCDSTIDGKLNNICNYTNCGDGELTKGEQCDDGNNDNRDGCFNCQLEIGFYCTTEPLSKSICLPCMKNCLQCNPNLQNTNIQCFQCNSGYYLQDGQCLNCSQQCLTCESKTKCVTCSILSEKPDQNGLCKKCNQEQGMYLEQGQCISKCGDGITSIEEECDDGNQNNNDGCSSQCKLEKYFDCQNSVCLPLYIPDLSVKYTNITTRNNLVLTFPQDQGDICKNIKIEIESFNQIEFSSIISFIQQNNSNSNCNIEFTFKKTIDTFNLIHLLIPIQLKSNYRLLSEDVREVIIIPRKQVIYSEEQMDQAEAASSIQDVVGNSLYFLFPSALLIGGFNFFFQILDILSWLNNLYYINIYYPENVRMFFYNSAWADVELIPAFFELNTPNDPYYCESPQKFMEKGVDPMFLNNTWTCLTIIIINIILYVFCFIVVFIINYCYQTEYKQQGQMTIFQINGNIETNNPKNIIKHTKIKQQPYLIKKLYDQCLSYKMSFIANLIKSLNIAFLDLVLAISLQETSVPDSSESFLVVKVNSVISYFCISLCSLIIAISYYVTTKHRVLLNNEEFQNRYGTLYEGINSQSNTAILYSFINIIRKALFIISIVYFYDQPLLQTTFCTLICFVNIALIIFKNPFESNAELLSIGIPDVCIFVLMLISTGYALDDITLMLTENERFQIGWIIISFITLSLLIQIIFMFREFILETIQKIKYLIEKLNQIFNK